MENEATLKERYARHLMLDDVGQEGQDKLSSGRVLIIGAGGLGSPVCLYLSAAGVGRIGILDFDTVEISNLQRQVIHYTSDVGKSKISSAQAKMSNINPNVKVNTYKLFFTPETEFDFSPYDYVVDAIDTVSGKIAIIEKSAGVPVISSMGAGNKMNPQMFEVTDIYKTSVCPLAKVMRQELKKRGIKSLKVVYSKENPIKPAQSTEVAAGKKRIPGSNAFTPSVAGLISAAEVIKDICGYQSSK